MEWESGAFGVYSRDTASYVGALYQRAATVMTLLPRPFNASQKGHGVLGAVIHR
jgi:hypothetical protein